MAPDGKQPEQVNDSATSVNLLTGWATDGRLLSQVAKGGRELNYRMRDLSSGQDSTLLPENTSSFPFFPELSPHRTEVAVQWNRDIRGLYVLSWPARVPRLLTKAWFRPIGWTSNGASIVVIGGGIWLVSKKDGHARRLVDAAVDSGDVTRDGKYAVVSVSSGTSDAWVIEHFDRRRRADH